MKRPRTAESRWPLIVGVTMAIALSPLPVEAHLNSTGMGPVYDGLLHFLLSPEDIIAVLALALFAGQRGIAYGRRALFVLPGAWLAGGLLGLTIAAMGGADSDISFFFAAGRIARSRRCPLPTRDHRSGRSDRTFSRIPEWRRNGTTRRWSTRSPGSGFCGLYYGGACFIVRRIAATAVG